MTRRLVTTALVFTALALPASAQQGSAISAPTSQTPAETSPNQALGKDAQQREQRVQQGGAPQDTGRAARQGANSAPATMGAQQSKADMDYIRDTMAAGTVSLQQANFALSKAQHPRLKQFAQFEVAEQTTLSDIMRSFADPASTASTTSGARQAASTAPELPAADAAVMEKLSKASAGTGFDRDYVAAQMKGHQDLLAIQERYLKSSPGNLHAVNVAKLSAGQIKEHIALLQDIQKELGR